MRASLIAGAILAVLGAFIIIKGVSYAREDRVFKLAGIEAKVQQERPIAQWTDGVALGAGLVLVIAGFRKGRK
jgi:drug/metabolite transporter (DMT)-like permease